MQLCHSPKLVTKDRFMQEKKIAKSQQEVHALSHRTNHRKLFCIGVTIKKYKSSTWMTCASNVERRREQWNNYCSDVPK